MVKLFHFKWCPVQGCPISRYTFHDSAMHDSRVNCISLHGMSRLTRGAQYNALKVEKIALRNWTQSWFLSHQVKLNIISFRHCAFRFAATTILFVDRIYANRTLFACFCARCFGKSHSQVFCEIVLKNCEITWAGVFLL